MTSKEEQRCALCGTPRERLFAEPISKEYELQKLFCRRDDLRPLPLSMRKAILARLLHRRPDGIFTGSFEQGEIGPELFRHACLMGLEGFRFEARRYRAVGERSGKSKKLRAPINRTGERSFRVIPKVHVSPVTRQGHASCLRLLPRPSV